MDKLNALILAKSNSSRLPNKNNLDFHGKPMFLENVEKCLRLFEDVYVSSDSEEMLQLAVDTGARGILRGEELCGDVPNIPVYQHAMAQMSGDAFVAVQANSPNVESNLISLAGRLLQMGVDEVMTCYPNRVIYGSIWGMTRDKLVNYENAYDPRPSVLIVDESIDIHTRDEYNQALRCWIPQS